MNKNIIFLAGGFLIGACAGYIAGKEHARKKQIEKENEEPRFVHLEYYDNGENQTGYAEEMTEESAEEVEVTEFSVKEGKLAVDDKIGVNYHAYNEAVQQEKDAAEAEFPKEEDTEPEEPKEDEYEGFYETAEQRAKRENDERVEEILNFKKEHGGKIEVLTKDDWNSDFITDDYEREELFYFPDEDILTDEDGTVLEPMEDYVGQILDRIGFKRNKDEEIYIRNNPKEMNFRIVKEMDITREEFFNY